VGFELEVHRERLRDAGELVLAVPRHQRLDRRVEQLDPAVVRDVHRVQDELADPRRRRRVVEPEPAELRRPDRPREADHGGLPAAAGLVQGRQVELAREGERLVPADRGELGLAIRELEQLVVRLAELLVPREVERPRIQILLELADRGSRVARLHRVSV